MPIPHHFCPDLPPIPSDVAGDKPDAKICIIGAGAAGLSAALSLKRMGFQNVVVLEAMDRPGGRLKATDGTFIEPVGGVPLDLGAEWIHSTRGEDVLKQIVTLNEKDELNESGVVPDLIYYQPDISLGSVWGKSSLFSWLYQEFKFKSTTWYGWLETNLYNPVKDIVELNSPISSIDYTQSENTNGSVRITLENGSTRDFDRVICTAPMNVLKEDCISFTPRLPNSMKGAMEKIQMPPGFRCAFQMKTKFYKDCDFTGGMWKLLTETDDLMLIYDMVWGKGLGEDVHVLACVGIGEKSAGEWAKLSDEELGKKILEKVDEMYDGQGTKNLIGKPVIQNWGNEKYVRGTYTFPGKKEYRAELAKPLGAEGQDAETKTVFFAGEHTSPDWFSLVPGAACEGRRAALEVVESLGLKLD